MELVIRLLLNASVFLLVSRLVPGFSVTSVWTAVWAALIFGIVNSLIRPILLAISLPLGIASLGLFTLVIDAGVMGLTAWLVPGLSPGIHCCPPGVGVCLAREHTDFVGSW